MHACMHVFIYACMYVYVYAGAWRQTCEVWGLGLGFSSGRGAPDL